jgi:signal transduction histidine kinase
LGVTDEVTLTVSDDGVGVPAEVLGGHGLANMAERARLLGGDATISARSTGGSLLVWRVPVRVAAEAKGSKS